MAQAQNPLEDVLRVPGAKPVLPASAAKKLFDNDFVAQARKYWGNFHRQMGGDHALYCNTYLPEFVPMAATPAVGEVSHLQRSPVDNVKATPFVHDDGSTSIPLDENVMNGGMATEGGLIK